MDAADAISVARDALTVLMQVAGPMMAVALVVGLGIGLFQALTQIQEMTLTFVPKIIAMFVVLLIMLPFIGGVMNSFMARIADRIVALG
jgi:flagellar biosynthetic protein FliQ